MTAGLGLSAMLAHTAPQSRYAWARRLGDLDAPQTAPLVPFALRWLRADLPARLDMVADTIDALYRLLEYCKTQLQAGVLCFSVMIMHSSGSKC